MKVTIDVDYSPEEARAFLGLPAVAPLQAALMEELQKRMLDGLAKMEPEALLKQWLPTGGEGWDQMQKAFWGQFTGGTKGGKP